MAAAMLLLPVSTSSTLQMLQDISTAAVPDTLAQTLQTKQIPGTSVYKYNKAKVNKYVQLKYLWWFPLQNVFTPTALAWSSDLHRLAQLRYLSFSWIEHRRLQAKLRTSVSNKTTKIDGSYHGIFQYWTHFPGTGYRAMAINPIVARLNFPFDNIIEIY